MSVHGPSLQIRAHHLHGSGNCSGSAQGRRGDRAGERSRGSQGTWSASPSGVPPPWRNTPQSYKGSAPWTPQMHVLDSVAPESRSRPVDRWGSSGCVNAMRVLSSVGRGTLAKNVGATELRAAGCGVQGAEPWGESPQTFDYQIKPRDYQFLSTSVRASAATDTAGRPFM